MGAAQLAAARSAAEDAGIAVTGLHWLLIKPAGLSISTRDDTVRKKTIDVMHTLIDQCAELGGKYLVHGSPHQRRVDPGEPRAAPLLASLKRHGYGGDIAVEPFDYVPDGPAAAARAIGYLRGILEGLPERPS